MFWKYLQVVIVPFQQGVRMLSLLNPVRDHRIAGGKWCNIGEKFLVLATAYPAHMWRFLKVGVPLNHPEEDISFKLVLKPMVLGIPHSTKSIHFPKACSFQWSSTSSCVCSSAWRCTCGHDRCTSLAASYVDEGEENQGKVEKICSKLPF